MLAGEVPGAEMHQPGIEAAMLPCRPSGKERGARAAVHDDVPVAAPPRQEPGVEVLIDESCPEHRHIGREIRIGAAHPGMGRAARSGVEVHDLTQRMHAGVGASGADHPHRRRRDPRQRPLDLALDRTPVGLALEAVEPAAVVFETERDAHCRGADSSWAPVHPRPERSPGEAALGPTRHVPRPPDHR